MAVRAAFHLMNINEIDEEAETFQFLGALALTWKDDRQAFDPNQAQVDEKVYQGSFQFDELSPAWYPQVALVNAAGLFEKSATLLRVKPDGTCKLIEAINAVARVDLDLVKCPFDNQSLEAIFSVPGFDRSEVVLEAEPMPAFEDNQRIHLPQWNLTNISSSTRERKAPLAGSLGASSAFVVTVDVQRQSFFLIRLVVAPLFVIVVLSWSVFWMDRSLLGDRIGVSFIGILTAVAYQMVVSGILPQISYVTLINAIVNFSFIVLCGTVVINLVVDGLDRRGKADVGDLVDRRCRWIFPLVYLGLLSIAVAFAFLFS